MYPDYTEICSGFSSWKLSQSMWKDAEVINNPAGEDFVEDQVGRDARFRCPRCGRAYKWKITLNRHLRLECGQERQFECAVCLMRFKRKSHLERHKVLTHSNNKMRASGLTPIGYGSGPSFKQQF